jgi:4-diphosphocytidyl-2-C-methyl-D-erythritol kinase
VESREIRLLCPAKINLFLHIRSRRPDGYHDIETLMQTVDLCDQIVLRSKREGIQLHLSGYREGVPEGERNLCVRAAKLLQEHYRIGTGVEIDLYKRIPPGSGLGGGSSDAAATLWGLKELWELPLSRTQLQDISLCLGSDVPFFLSSGCGLVAGRGESVKEVLLPSRPVVIVYLGFGVSTAWAYERYDARQSELTEEGKRTNMKKFRTEARSPLVQALSPYSLHQGNIDNELEEVVAESHPIILRLKQGLLRCGAEIALMSGSGSAVYGLFSDQWKAKKAAEEWRGESYWVHEGWTLDFNPILSPGVDQSVLPTADPRGGSA